MSVSIKYSCISKSSYLKNLPHAYSETLPLCFSMQFVTNFRRIKCPNNFLPENRVNYVKLRFWTKQRKLYFHIINIHTQGYITLIST